MANFLMFNLVWYQEPIWKRLIEYKMMQKAGFEMKIKAWTQGSSQARITVESAKPFLAIMSFEWYSKPIVCFSEEHKVVNQKRTKKIQDNINLKGDTIFKVSEEINTIHLLILMIEYVLEKDWYVAFGSRRL